ncbi:MAG TPA: hypothetical protein V6C69_16120 [Trichormus sp.]
MTTISGNCALSADQRKLESDGKHHWLFPNHPRWRRIAKASGFGVATGGILGPILGVGAVAGATAGAAEHGGVRAWKDKHDVKRGKHLDQHIW